MFVASPLADKQGSVPTWLTDIGVVSYPGREHCKCMVEKTSISDYC